MVSLWGSGKIYQVAVGWEEPPVQRYMDAWVLRANTTQVHMDMTLAWARANPGFRAAMLIIHGCCCFRS